MKSLKRKLYIIIIGLLHIIACNQPNIEKYRIPKNITPVAVDEKANDSIGNVSALSNADLMNKLEQAHLQRKYDSLAIVWEKPESWLDSFGSKMRLGSYKVPYVGGYADLSITMLSGAAGGIQANVNRWRSQIRLPNQGLVEINNSAEDRVCGIGDYKGFEIVNPNNGIKAFLCSIIPNGDSTIFVKLSIEANAINEVKSDFFKFCDSFKLNDE